MLTREPKAEAQASPCGGPPHHAAPGSAQASPGPALHLQELLRCTRFNMKLSKKKKKTQTPPKIKRALHKHGFISGFLQGSLILTKKRSHKRRGRGSFLLRQPQAPQALGTPFPTSPRPLRPGPAVSQASRRPAPEGPGRGRTPHPSPAVGRGGSAAPAVLGGRRAGGSGPGEPSRGWEPSPPPLAHLPAEPNRHARAPRCPTPAALLAARDLRSRFYWASWSKLAFSLANRSVRPPEGTSG